MSATRPWVDAFADLMEQKLASCRDAPELWASEDAQSLAQRIAYVARDLNDDWERARLGIPTASNFDRILSPKKLAPSSQQQAYLYQLVAERLIGLPVVDASTPWMERGTELEASARAYYELTTGTEVKPCGLAVLDNGKVGASPDGLISNVGALELKCPAVQTHIGYLLDGPGDAYRLQMQGQMWVSGLDWRFVDFLSFCPGLPPVLIRVKRDDEAQDALSETLPNFWARRDEAHARILAMMPGERLAIENEEMARG